MENAAPTIMLALIRHGQTEGNTKRRYIGRTDEPLCEAGIQAAQGFGACESASSWPGPIYTSSLLRTQQTAQIIFPNAKLTALPGLAEMDFGRFEEKSAADLEFCDAYRQWVEEGCLTPCPGGESKAQFCERVREAFAKLAQQHAKTAQPLIMVVHGGTIMAIMEAFAQPARDYFSWHASCCQGFLATLQITDGQPVITNAEPLTQSGQLASVHPF